jgi:hypothetical protein
MLSTDDPSFDGFVYITALQGDYQITVPLNIHALNFKSSLRDID